MEDLHFAYIQGSNFFFGPTRPVGLNFSLVLTPVELVLKSGILKDIQGIF